MKTQKESTSPVIRNKYTAQFKGHALELADWDGIPNVAHDLGLGINAIFMVIKTPSNGVAIRRTKASAS
jgi:hypothetical protein